MGGSWWGDLSLDLDLGLGLYSFPFIFMFLRFGVLFLPIGWGVHMGYGIDPSMSCSVCCGLGACA